MTLLDAPPHPSATVSISTKMILRNGDDAIVRPVDCADEQNILDFGARCSDESMHFRLFGPRRTPTTRERELITDIDGHEGHDQLEASVLGDNRRMLGVFSHSGLTIDKQLHAGVFDLTLQLRSNQGEVS